MAMPRMCGKERRKPALAPDAISIRLLGPGVPVITATKPISATNCSVDMAVILLF